MALDVTREITIAAPREQVWAYLIDFPRHPEWSTPSHNLRISPPAQVRAGATFSSIGRDEGRDAQNEVTITELVPARRIAFNATMDVGTEWRNAYELSDAGSGTRVTKDVGLIRGPFLRSLLLRILAPLIKGEEVKVLDGDLARLKERVEGLT